MSIEVRYLSKTGNTKKVAEAIAEATGVEAKSIPEPVGIDTGLPFLGCAVYGFGIDKDVEQFAASLPETVGRVALFSTTAVVTSAGPKVRDILNKRGIQLAAEEFHCWGKFTVMHKGHPNTKDLEQAAAFARRVATDGA